MNIIPPRTTINGGDTSLLELRSESLENTVIQQGAPTIVRYLDVKTLLLSFSCTSKSNHSLVQYEVLRRKRKVHDLKREIASLIHTAYNGPKKNFFIPRHDLLTRAFSLQEQSLALIDSGLPRCTIHPLHGHVCYCHCDPLFHEQRRLLMIHNNLNSDEMPMSPLIFYCMPDDHNSCISKIIARTIYLRRPTLESRNTTIDQYNRLLTNMRIAARQAVLTIGPLEGHEMSYFEQNQAAEFRRCAEDVVDFCFRHGLVEYFRRYARKKVQDNHAVVRSSFLELCQYTLRKMNSLLSDFAKHKRRMNVVLKELRTVKRRMRLQSHMNLRKSRVGGIAAAHLVGGAVAVAC